MLVNSNPATIMTDPEFADATYVEPLLPGPVEQIIERERPDALLPTLGGQTALNLAKALHDDGTLERYGVELIGANYDAITCAEDRELFGVAMAEAGLRLPRQRDRARRRAGAGAACRTSACLASCARPSPSAAAGEGSPAGAGVRADRGHGLEASPISQVLIDESVHRLGRVRAGGDARQRRQRRDRLLDREHRPDGRAHRRLVTVAPQQTLTDDIYQQLRDQAIAVIRAVGVETGGSNVQFAVNPATEEILVIEMNPRVSRSSALASKATGFPIAKIAARLAVGYPLEEITNDITGVPPRASSRRSTTSSSSGRALPSRSSRRRRRPDHAHEVGRRGDGDRAHLRRRRSPRRCARASSTRRRSSPRPTRSCSSACGAGRRPLRRRCSRRCAAAHAIEEIHGARRSTRGSCASWGDRDDPEAPFAGERSFKSVDTCAAEFAGPHALLLLGLGAPRRRSDGSVPSRGRARRARERRDPRRRAQPHRPGHRVRLLLRARRA